MSFDRFMHQGLVKTYNADRQTPDSAGTATAYLTGVKANFMTIGVDQTVKVRNSLLKYKKLTNVPNC